MTRLVFILTLLIGLAFAGLGSVFQAVSDTLDHTAVGFEKRGILHHVWHGLVWIGGFVVLYGLMERDRLVTLVGLGAVSLAIAWNTAAILDGGSPNALDVIGRAVVLGIAAFCIVYAGSPDE